MFKKFLCLVILCFLFGAAAFSETDDNTITLPGIAKFEVKPDIAFIKLFVCGKGILLVDSEKSAKETINQIEKELKAFEKNISALQISDYSVGENQQRVWSSDRDNEPRPEIIKQLLITCEPNPEIIYQIIDKAIRNGAVLNIQTNISYSGDIKSSVIYGISKSDEIEKKLINEIIIDCRNKASLIAAEFGKKIKEIVKIADCGSSNAYRIYGRQTDIPSDYFSADPLKIVVNKSLNITFKFEWN